jgi:hypothetical protein
LLLLANDIFLTINVAGKKNNEKKDILVSMTVYAFPIDLSADANIAWQTSSTTRPLTHLKTNTVSSLNKFCGSNMETM